MPGGLFISKQRFRPRNGCRLQPGPRPAESAECTGTSVTLWTGDIRYKSLAVVGA